MSNFTTGGTPPVKPVFTQLEPRCQDIKQTLVAQSSGVAGTPELGLVPYIDRVELKDGEFYYVYTEADIARLLDQQNLAFNTGGGTFFEPNTNIDDVYLQLLKCNSTVNYWSWGGTFATSNHENPYTATNQLEEAWYVNASGNLTKLYATGTSQSCEEGFKEIWVKEGTAIELSARACELTRIADNYPFAVSTAETVAVGATVGGNVIGQIALPLPSALATEYRLDLSHAINADPTAGIIATLDSFDTATGAYTITGVAEGETSFGFVAVNYDPVTNAEIISNVAVVTVTVTP